MLLAHRIKLCLPDQVTSQNTIQHIYEWYPVYFCLPANCQAIYFAVSAVGNT